MSKDVKIKLLCLLAGLLLAGCGDQSFSLVDALPGADAVLGWTPAGEVEIYEPGNLYDLVNGQADAFFAYAFEKVAVQEYENLEGAALRAEVWQVATPADAYGLFAPYRSGTPVAIGNEGDGDQGRRLDFWQDRYVVRLFARQTLPDADLQALAEAIAKALPRGGERPALVDRLPPDGLVARSAIFFHQEISIQSQLWLGGENLLGLSPETDGVLARYDLSSGPAQLLLVQYPDAKAASAGLEALQARQMDNLAAALGHKELLGAVFGTVDKATAGELLTAALEKE